MNIGAHELGFELGALKCSPRAISATLRTTIVAPSPSRYDQDGGVCERRHFYNIEIGFLTEVIRGVFHLPRNSGNSGWDVNGTHVFGSFHWKISGINGTSEKVVLFSPWKLSDGNVCSIYNF